jgi:hypothetical protein
MTADVITLPVAEQSIADLLDDAAAREAPLFEIARYASPLLSADALADAWDDLCEAVRVRDGLGTGLIHWSEPYPDLTCFDRQDTALQLACEQTDYARNVIQHGNQFGGTR